MAAPRVPKRVFRPVRPGEFILMVSTCADRDIDVVDLDRPGCRGIAQTLVRFRSHTPPVSGAIDPIQLFIRKCMVVDLFRKAFQILVALSLFLGTSARFGKDFFSSWLGRGILGQLFRFVEEGELFIKAVGLLCLSAITLLVGDPDLFDKVLEVRVYTIQLFLHGQDDRHEFAFIEPVQFFAGVVFCHICLRSLYFIIQEMQETGESQGFHPPSLCLLAGRAVYVTDAEEYAVFK